MSTRLLVGIRVRWGSCESTSMISERTTFSGLERMSTSLVAITLQRAVLQPCLNNWHLIIELTLLALWRTIAIPSLRTSHLSSLVAETHLDWLKQQDTGNLVGPSSSLFSGNTTSLSSSFHACSHASRVNNNSFLRIRDCESIAHPQGIAYIRRTRGEFMFPWLRMNRH